MSAFVAELVRGDGPVRATAIANLRERSWIVGDVRLDGREALLAALGAAGARVTLDSRDADLVLAAWNAWGERAVERLTGDFSFALWDHARHVLFCARDPLGVRPLFWAEFGRAFVCSNEIDAIREHPAATSRLHEPAVVSFLRWGYNADTATTTFTDIRRLPPAHQLTVSAGGTVGDPRRYWDFPAPEPLRLKRDEEYVERFRDVLGHAVRDRLRAPRAAILLSGGLDSTAIAATARRVAPEVALAAWTYDMGPSAPADEVRLASAAASRLGIRQEIVREADVPFAHLADPDFRTPEPLDEPDWGSWQRLAETIFARAPVLLVGEDGDALFKPPGLITMMRAWTAFDVMRRMVAYGISHGRHPYFGFWIRKRLAAPFKPGARRVPPWIRADLLARVGERVLPVAPLHSTRPESHRLLSDSVWQCVLEPSQPAYTGVPLELEWPLLDTRVIEFVFSIPPVPWCQRKELVRRAFRGDLPNEILRRPKSPLHGFSERQLSQWRAVFRPDGLRLGERIREFVDTRNIADTLQGGSLLDASEAWRVLALDQWLQSGARSRAD